MARIVYALSGEGRGHTSRALAIAEALELEGHEVLYCAGGVAYEILTELNKPVLRVPALEHVVYNNTLRPWRTLWHNLPHLLRSGRLIRDLARSLEAFQAEWLINDFEYFSGRAAALLGLPVVGFNRQQILTEARYPIPWRWRLNAALVGAVVRWIAPPQAVLTLIPTFLPLPLRRPERVRLVPPVIRSAVLRAEPAEGEHVLVYINRSRGAEKLLRLLERFAEVPFHVYGFSEAIAVARNVKMRPSSLEGFLRDLASARAVIATAGFTLISEALYLGKPLLALPNRGIFEQTLNAWQLAQAGFGAAVVGRDPTLEDISGFLARWAAYKSAIQRRFEAGNPEVLRVLTALWGPERPEPVLSGLRGSVY
ncbi:MAG: glycosyltransferase family protein [Bacteroidota bacterium]|nr:glycosyl transferase [Rhodothermia bacterium]MCS7155186.1 glycosyl transferase [Bacteroidota bacterium]MDW8138314.1 glycosyltransferase family protein [Bacteroidota bacterium]MDW8285999.1 glycosyltransferase family protein [Bacteroidota bacterium]